MADLFGFSGALSSLATGLETKASGAVNSLIGQGLNRAESKINNALGPIFGSGFTGVNPESWLAKANSRPDPHLSFDWTIVLPNDPGSLFTYVEEATSPVWMWTGTDAVFRGGQSMYYPERLDTTTLELVFYEDRLFSASSYIQTWMNQVGSPLTGLYNYPNAYKKNITITAQDAAQNPIATLVYYGCWPTDMGSYSFQSATSERTRISAKIAVDGMSLQIGSSSVAASNFGVARITDFIRGVPQSLASSAVGAAGIALNNAVGSLF